MRFRRTHGVLIGVTALALIVSACGAGKKSSSGGGGGSASGGGGGGPITVGTTDKVTAIDPAGSYDNGSLLVEIQMYQFLMSIPAKAQTPQPDAAESCSFTKPTEYTCKMKSGLKFGNGDPLTAKDVAFTFQRQVKINDPNGPASLLGNMASVAAPDDSTVVFTLKAGNDQTWPYVLGTAAGPIVDSKVFPADKLLPDEQTVGSGPYKIASYSKNQLVQFEANPNYGGPYKPQTSKIALKYYTTAPNLKLDVQSGAIDVAWRSLTPTDIDSLRSANEREGAYRPRRRTALHRLQLQDDAGQQRRAEARRPTGDGLLGRSADALRQGVQGHLQAVVFDGARWCPGPHRRVQGRSSERPRTRRRQRTS